MTFDPLAPRGKVCFETILSKGIPPDPYGRKHKRNYLCNDNVWRSMRQISRTKKISENTLYARISKYGLDSKLILLSGHINKAKVKKFEPFTMEKYLANFDGVFNKPIKAWDRSKCKRNGIACVKYGECQGSRCGLPGYPKWDNRETTCGCYNANHEPHHDECLSLIAAMIEGAKQEVLNIRDKKTKPTDEDRVRFSECRRWLANSNGGLEVLLQSVGEVSTNEALNELEHFANTGFITEKNTGEIR